MSTVALLLFAHAHGLKPLTFKSPVDSLSETGGFLLVILPFLRIVSQLHARSLLHSPPSDNYRYLFFINEVKLQLSLHLLELRWNFF